MATEQNFKSKFVAPLTECYGPSRLPAIRVTKIWERLKHYPDHLLGQCADRIVIAHENFPGVQKILEACGEVFTEHSRAEIERIKSSVNCHRCRSQGVIVVDNLAYKCSCQLGELCYPAYAPYRGQVATMETESFDKDGNRTFENGTMLSFVPKGARDIREVRTVIKSGERKPAPDPAKDEKRDRVSYDQFLKGPA